MATTNYSLPEFSSTDSVDLIGVYNAAMEAIDKKLKELNDSIANTTDLDAVKLDVATLKSSVSTINSNISGINSSISGINSNITPGTSDKSLTVEELNGAKLTAGGIVYYKKA